MSDLDLDTWCANWLAEHDLPTAEEFWYLQWRRQLEIVKRFQPTIEPRLPDAWADNMGRRHYNYWRKRGIGVEVIMRYKVGWNGQRYTIPWFCEGVVMAVKMRRDDDVTPSLEPKYISLRGSQFVMPYNIDAVLWVTPRTLLIVEDEKSVWAAEQHGITAISCPAGSFKPEWAGLISRIPQIIIVADNDEAGRKSAGKIKSILGRGEVVTPQRGDLFDVCEAFIGIPGATGCIREWLGV